MNIILFANGPGELYERALPFARLLRNTKKKYYIILIITPCQFSSGREYDTAKELKVFDKVFRLKTFFSIFEFLNNLKVDFVVHFGGDIIYPIIFSLVFNAKLYSYSNFFRFNYFVNKYIFFSPYSFSTGTQKGVPIYRMMYGGNLSFWKNITIFYEKNIRNTYEIGLFPGSREVQFEHILPFFIKVIEELKKRGLKIQANLYLSPFISLDFLENILNKGPRYKVIDYSLGELVIKKGKYFIITEQGIYIEVKRSHKDIEKLDFALCTPGTSTLTLSNLAIPMVVVSPLNKVETIPLNGLLNYVASIPYIGPWAKKKVVLGYLNKRKYLALPNIIEDREIVKEVRGILKPSDIVNVVIGDFYPKKRLYKTREKLIEFRKKYRFRSAKVLGDFR